MNIRDINQIFSDKIKYLHEDVFKKDVGKTCKVLNIAKRTLYDYLSATYLKDADKLPSSKFINKLNDQYLDISSPTYNFLENHDLTVKDFEQFTSVEDFKEIVKKSFNSNISKTDAEYLTDKFIMYSYDYTNKKLSEDTIEISQIVLEYKSKLYANINWKGSMFKGRVIVNKNQKIITFEENSGNTIFINIALSQYVSALDTQKILKGLINYVSFKNNAIVPISKKCILVSTNYELVENDIISSLLEDRIVFSDDELQVLENKDLVKNIQNVLKKITKSHFLHIENIVSAISKKVHKNMFGAMIRSEMEEFIKTINRFAAGKNFTIQNPIIAGLSFLKNIQKYSKDIESAHLLTTVNDNFDTSLYNEEHPQYELYKKITLEAAKKTKLVKIYSIRTNTYNNEDHMQSIISVMVEQMLANMDIFVKYNFNKDEYLEIGLLNDFAIYEENTKYESIVTRKVSKIKRIENYFQHSLKNSINFKELLISNNLYRESMVEYVPEIRTKIYKLLVRILKHAQDNGTLENLSILKGDK